MTNELVQRLMTAGLTKQQATSVTAETLTNLFMPNDGKILLAEAHRQVADMRRVVNSLRHEYNQLLSDMKQVSKVILGISEAQNEFGSISDERAKNVLALYGALLAMNEKIGCSGKISVENAGYIIYAFLGGQAKREISYHNSGSDIDECFKGIPVK